MKVIPLIIARTLLKISNGEEKDTLTQWENISKENTSFLESLKTYWDRPADEVPNDRLEAARKRLLVRLSTQGNKVPKRTFIAHISRVAAAILLLISVSGTSIYLASKSGLFHSGSHVEVATEAGQQSKVTLPDGSFVWLNAETHLTYNFEKNERVVVLSGEAYFEVKHNPEHPFIVETGDTRIKDLGTKFNVSHYPDSNITQTSLLSGKICMLLPENNERIELIPGQKLTYNKEEHSFSKTTVNVQNEILWRQGVLVFENESFDGLIKKLERYYAVKFIYDRTSFQNKHYTGTINNLSINKVLDFISLTIPMHYEINNKTIKLNYKRDK